MNTYLAPANGCLRKHMHECKDIMRGFHKVILQNKQDDCSERDVQYWKETIPNFIRFLLQEKGIKPDLYYPVKCFNFLMRCRLSPPIAQFMACKEKRKLCMNQGSLDRKLVQPFVVWQIHFF